MKKYFYTIGEVSNLLGEKPYVIRYWESEFSFLKPRKDEGRIRKYSEENIQLLKKIQDMLHTQRFTIEGARQKLKAERSAARHGELPDPAKPVAAATDDKQTLQLKKKLRVLRRQLVELREQCLSLREKGK